MATPTYEDVKRQKMEAKAQQQAVNQTAQANAQTGAAMEGNKNPMLQQYMQRANQQRLGDPGGYSRLAAEVGNTAKNQDEYSSKMLDMAVNGELNPELMLEDPAVLDRDKNYILGLLEQTAAAGQTQVGPRGLM